MQEELYLPVDVSYESMEERIGGIAYVNDNNLFYILIDDTLYAINLISREVMTEVSGLAQGTYAVSKGRNMIAYSEIIRNMIRTVSAFQYAGWHGLYHSCRCG